MGRSNLELGCDNLFIKKLKNQFNAADFDLLARVYFFSKEKTASLGSIHLKAADLLIEQDADAITVAGALLLPLLWQNLAEPDEINKYFDQTIAPIIKDLNSPLVLRTDTEDHRRMDIRAFLESLDGLPNKALLLMTFRLIELENSVEPYEADVRQIAQETLDIYVPIANRLSLGEIRRRLEDACFRILDIYRYRLLKQKVTPIRAEDDKCLEILMAGVQHLLIKNGIQGRIQGRTKSLYAIRCKMTKTGKTLEQIMDRVGLRIIVASVPECYSVLGLLHSHFKPIPGTFDDYIGLPKDNGYQSLHTCVYPVREISHKPIEFQVRTELMHMEAEHGAAAHWRYKNESASVEKTRFQREWMQGLVQQHENTVDTDAFIDLLHRQVFEDHLVVFGNGGRIMRLPGNATVQDYLNRSNIYFPEVVVVKVNGERADLDQLLQDGDSIEVLADEPAAGSRFAEVTAQNALSVEGVLRPFDAMPGDRESSAKAMA